MVEFNASTHAVRIHSGRAALSGLPSELDRCGANRALVVCGRSVAERTDLIPRIRDLLGDRLAGVYAGIAKDAPVACVREAVDAARDCRADILLAVGAGSVIKAVRVVAILLAEDRPVEELVTRYPEGGRAISPKLQAQKLPILNILTAATSAQNRAGAALRNEGSFRMEFFDPKTRPRAVFWDADALLTAPPSLALSTGVSIYWRALMNIGAVETANPLVQASRLHAFRLAQDALPRMQDGADYEARIEMCAAAMLQNRDEDDGGRPFDMHWITRVVYALAAACFNLVGSVGQGQAYAALTGAAIRHFGARCPDVTAAIGRALGVVPEGMQADTVAATADAADAAFRRFGMPVRLRELGVPQDQLSEIVRLSLQNFNADRNRDFAAQTALLSATLQDAW